MIRKIYDQRHGMSVITGSTRISRMKEPDLGAIHDWIRDQQKSEAPDSLAWDLLLASDAMLGQELKCLLAKQTDMRKNILYASSSVRLVSQDLADWNKYPRAIRFMLTALNRDEVYVFDSEHPVIMSVYGNTENAWSLHFDEQVQDVMDMMVKLQKLDVTDVLRVLLRSWLLRRAKADQARERLCDIGTRCLSLAANP